MEHSANFTIEASSSSTRNSTEYLIFKLSTTLHKRNSNLSLKFWSLFKIEQIGLHVKASYWLKMFIQKLKCSMVNARWDIFKRFLYGKQLFWSIMSSTGLLYQLQTFLVLVKGGFTQWTEWSACSKTCGPWAVRMRMRLCTNPPPAFGGNDCNGWRFHVEYCKGKECPQRPGNYNQESKV